MNDGGEVYVSVAVEGRSDEGMARAVLEHVGFEVVKIIPKGGKSRLDEMIPGLSRTSTNNPWVVFRDADAECPVTLRSCLIGAREHDGSFELRIVQSMTEAWLMADIDGFARHFSIHKQTMSVTPDDLRHAKKELFSLLAKSRSRAVRQDMVSPKGQAGPLYTSGLNEFALNVWDIDVARQRSPSLDRTLERLADMHRILS